MVEIYTGTETKTHSNCQWRKENRLRLKIQLNLANLLNLRKIDLKN